MVSRANFSSTEYPSLVSVHLFWQKEQEEYTSANDVHRNDGCEKAFRAATKADDALLSSNGYFVPVGQSMAHLKRTEFLLALRDIVPEAKEITKYIRLIKINSMVVVIIFQRI